MTAETIHTCSYSCDRPECIRAQRDELAARLTAPPSAPVGVEKVKKALERLDRTIEACAKLTQLLGDGQPHIDLISTAGGQAALAKEAIQRALDQQPAAVTVDGAVLYRACEVYAEITEDCMGLVRRRAMREALAVAQQPAIGEEIMVNAAHGVFTLLLQPSGLPSGPRFVVQVPAPEQKPASTSGAVNVVGMPEFDDLMDHIYEYGTTAEGVVERANAFARAVLAQYAPQQPAAVDEAMVERSLAAYLRRQEDGESLYGCVTAALTAALAAQPGGSDNDR